MYRSIFRILDLLLSSVRQCVTFVILTQVHVKLAYPERKPACGHLWPIQRLLRVRRCRGFLRDLPTVSRLAACRRPPRQLANSPAARHRAPAPQGFFVCIKWDRIYPVRQPDAIPPRRKEGKDWIPMQFFDRSQACGQGTGDAPTTPRRTSRHRIDIHTRRENLRQYDFSVPDPFCDSSLFATLSNVVVGRVEWSQRDTSRTFPGRNAGYQPKNAESPRSHPRRALINGNHTVSAVISSGVFIGPIDQEVQAEEWSSTSSSGLNIGIWPTLALPSSSMHSIRALPSSDNE